MNPIAAIQQLVIALTSRSWKTTLAGALAATGAYFQTVPGYEKYGVWLLGASVFVGFLCARDRNVSSEMQSGVPGAAMPEKPRATATVTVTPP
jgi:hypothetical protein